MSRGGATRWRKGQSGNPLGVRRRSATTQQKIRKMIEDASEEIVSRQITLAVKGHPLVAKVLLGKVLPDASAKSSPIEAPIELKGTPTERAEAILTALAAGELSQDSATVLLQAVRITQEIADAAELGQRLSQIEERLAALASGGIAAKQTPGAENA
jgi:hypothetical protein